MNPFKSNVIEIHPSEKIMILSFVFLASLFFMALGYTALKTGTGMLFGVGLIIIGALATVITYLILHGKGISRHDS